MIHHYITRGELFNLFLKWQSGELSTQDVWDWASHHYLPGEMDYDDWEDESSVAHEILYMLDSLDMNLVLVDDAEIHLAFLGTPVGDFQEGYRTWQQAREQIDLDSRRLQLQGHPIYGSYCKLHADGET